MAVILLVSLVIAALIGTFTRGRRMSPGMTGYGRWNFARRHPLWYGAFFAVVVFLVFFYEMTTRLPVGSALVVALLIGTGAGLLGTIVGFIVQRSQPSS